MIVDFNLLKAVVDEFDHRDLNELADFKETGLQTTAENICTVLAHKLQTVVGTRVSIDQVVVRETPRSAAKWRKRSPLEM